MGDGAVEAAALAAFHADGAMAACSVEAKSESGPWMVVFTFNHGSAEQQLRVLWASKGLQKVWPRDGLVFKAAGWKPPQEFVQIADCVRFNLGKSASN